MQKTDHLKLPPHSLEAEQSVLGGLLLDNQAWDRIADKLKEKDFYLLSHRILFRTISRFANQAKPFDIVTLTDALKNTNELTEAGGDLYLFEVVRNTPSAANIAAYADIVREHSILRQLIGIASEITENAFMPEGRSITELVDEAEQKFFRFLIKAHEEVVLLKLVIFWRKPSIELTSCFILIKLSQGFQQPIKI